MKRLRWLFVLGILALGVGAGAVAFTVYDQYWRSLPPISNLLTYDPPVATRVYADNGQLVGEFFFEKRYLTPIEKIPPVVRDAFVAAEDSEFYEHPGIDVRGILRAFLANVQAGSVVQGGSTITQQVVKQLLLTPERSYRRKLREIMLSVKLERELTKDEILYLYLNQIYLGDGNYGVGAAARAYFGKTAAELDLAEAALLAGLPKAPSRYSPTRNPEGALTRQRYVLRRMLAEGFVNTGAYRGAIRSGLNVLAKTRSRATVGSYYTEYVRRYLVDRFGERATYYKGFRVHTGMNLKMQTIAEAAVRRGIETLDLQLGYLGPIGHLTPEETKERLAAQTDRDDLLNLEQGVAYDSLVTRVEDDSITVTLGPHSSEVDVKLLKWHAEVENADRRFIEGDVVETTPVADDDGTILLALTQTPQVEASLLAIDAPTGHVKAMVGGYDFARSQFNRATQAYRQPGSAFKPLVYAAALDSGYTPASVLLDAPIQFVDNDEIWRPQNYSRQFFGPTTLRRALEKSRNVVTVRVVQDLGVEAIADYVSRFGFSRKIGRNLSVGLGTSEVSLLELTSAYSVFANAGRKVDPMFITRIEDSAGNLLDEYKGNRAVIMPEQTAYLLTSMLEGVVQNGTGRNVKSLNRPTAGKTGTTNDQHDAWFMGYTPDVLAGVWVGYDDQRTLSASGTGGKVAAPIWLDFMKQATAGTSVSDFVMPEGILCVHVDPQTGLRARHDNVDAYLECFRRGTEPRTFTPIWKYDPELGTETLVTDETADPVSTHEQQPLAPPIGRQIFQ
jgi:penicillin-binding protein 1A